MTALAVSPVQTQDFKTELIVDGSKLSLKLSGNADIRVMFPLEAMLKKLESEVAARKIKEVIVDLKDLEFMNSSCFKSFVTWLGNVQEYEPERQYPIRFLSDPTKHWQQRSLAALSCFAVDLVHVES
jgi:hypothetical protein